MVMTTLWTVVFRLMAGALLAQSIYSTCNAQETGLKGYSPARDEVSGPGPTFDVTVSPEAAKALRSALAKPEPGEQSPKKKSKPSRENARHPGKPARTVRKSDDFWDNLGFSGVVKTVFNGMYTGVPGKPFKVYYYNLQTAYSNKCRGYLSEKAVRRGYVSQTVYGDGSRDTPEVHDVYIDPRFVRKFDAFEREVTATEVGNTAEMIRQLTRNILQGGNIGRELGRSLGSDPAVQLMRFIDNTGCESSAVYQLRENFLRAAYGKPSLQLEAGEISRTEIDHYVPEEKKLYAACINRPAATERYCTCFSRKAETVMTLKERKYFAEDFDRYYKDVQERVSQERPPAQDRVWDLYKIFADCAA